MVLAFYSIEAFGIRCRWHGVNTPSVPRMATADALDSQPHTAHYAMRLYRFHSILAAGGIITATCWRQGRDKALIETNRCYYQLL